MQNEHILTCTLIRSWYSSKDETHSSSPSTITLVFCLVLLPPDSDGSSRRILLLGWGSMLSIRSFSRFSNRSSSSCLVSFSMVLWSGKWRKKDHYNLQQQWGIFLHFMMHDIVTCSQNINCRKRGGSTKIYFFFLTIHSVSIIYMSMSMPQICR